MLFSPKRRRSSACAIATFQAFALAALFLGIRPHRSLTSAENVSGHESWLVTSADYLEVISINRTQTAIDGQQAESGLANKVLDIAKVDRGFLLNQSDSSSSYRSMVSGFSLIRSPPLDHLDKVSHSI